MATVGVPMSRAERLQFMRLESLEAQSPLEKYKEIEQTLDRNMSAHEALAARQELFALGRILAHTKEGPPHLLAEATMQLGAAYGCLGLHTQALQHANTSVLLSHELCQFLEHWPFHTESEAPQLWQRCVSLLARLELSKYRSSHHKTDLLKSLAHFETAFPIIRKLRDMPLDEALPESVAEYLEQHFEVAACVGEVYAAVGSEEVSLSEGMLARMNEGSDATAAQPANPHSQPGAEDDEWMDDDTKECLQSQRTGVVEVTQSVCKARQALEVALSTLQICEQQVETSIATSEPHETFRKFGTFFSHQEPQLLLKHLRTRVNECLYNMALSDTMDCSRDRHQALREAKGKLYEVTGRVIATGDELPWPLQGQVLKLQGQILLELGHAKEAAKTYETLSEILKSKCSKPSKHHSIKDEIEDCDLQWAIALRKTGDSDSVQTAAQILSHLHQSMKRRLPRWHNRRLELEKELEAARSFIEHMLYRRYLLKGKRTIFHRQCCRCIRARYKASNMLEQKRFCIVSDLDHTMVDHTDHTFPALLEFNKLWLSKFAHDSYLVFSTGRSLISYTELRRTVPLLTPDLLICSVGTEIYQHAGDSLELDAEWIATLDVGWNREKVDAIISADFDKLSPQPAVEQRPHKVSFHLNKEGIDDKQYIQSLEERLKKEGLDVKVVYSAGIDVDVLPACASKGLALQFLQKRWEASGRLPREGIQVNGDSGNDAELFEAPGVYGCIVSNAMAELVHWADAHPSERLFRATERCTAGIMQTMYHFGKVPDDADLDAQAKAYKALMEVYAIAMAWRNGTVPNDSDMLQKQLLSRLKGSQTGTSSDSADPLVKSLLTDAPSLHSCCSAEGSKGQLLWLDDMVGTEADMGAWKIRYKVCRMKVEGEREPEMQCEAVMLPDSGAPEGYVLSVFLCAA